MSWHPCIICHGVVKSTPFSTHSVPRAVGGTRNGQSLWGGGPQIYIRQSTLFPIENTDNLVEIRAFIELVSDLWDSFFDVPLCLKQLFSFKIAGRAFLLDYNIFKYFNMLTFQKNKKLLSVLILSQTGIYRFKIYQRKIFTPVLKVSQYHGLLDT